jgi:hypothetical protein
LLVAEPAESLPQQSGDAMVPGRINGTKMRHHRVGGQRPRTRQNTTERKRANDRARPLARRESGVSSAASLLIVPARIPPPATKRERRAMTGLSRPALQPRRRRREPSGWHFFSAAPPAPTRVPSRRRR